MRRAVLALAALVATAAQAQEPVSIDLRKPAPAGIEWDGSQRLSVPVPEGNHRVTLTWPNAAAAAKATVKAETRRVMIVAGSTRDKTRSFIVNTRNAMLAPPPENAPGGTVVRLNKREQGSKTWDDQLSLQFLGAAPDTVAIAAATGPTIYLAGDSTVTDQGGAGSSSWGQMLPRFFGSDVAVANHAESGETLKSFITGMRLDKMLSRMTTGDWLVIQFGHNDEKASWPQTYAEAATTYRAYLRAFVSEARRRGATPILVTPPERRNFDAAGKIAPSHGGYPAAVRAVGAEEHVPVIDLTTMSQTFYEALGPEKSPIAFANKGQDKTHHADYGAYELARMVVEGIRTADPKLAAHLAPDAGRFDPAKPDAPERFAVPN